MSIEASSKKNYLLTFFDLYNLGNIKFEKPGGKVWKKTYQIVFVCLLTVFLFLCASKPQPALTPAAFDESIGA